MFWKNWPTWPKWGVAGAIIFPLIVFLMFITGIVKTSFGFLLAAIVLFPVVILALPFGESVLEFAKPLDDTTSGLLFVLAITAVAYFIFGSLAGLIVSKIKKTTPNRRVV